MTPRVAFLFEPRQHVAELFIMELKWNNYKLRCSWYQLSQSCVTRHKDEFEKDLIVLFSLNIGLCNKYFFVSLRKLMTPTFFLSRLKYLRS